MESIEVSILRKQFPVEMFLENLMEVCLVQSKIVQLQLLLRQFFNTVLDSQEFSMVRLILFKEFLIIFRIPVLLRTNCKEINHHKEKINTKAKVNHKRVKFTQKFKLCILHKYKAKFFHRQLIRAINKCF